jgi:HAMP domain-containing protein
MKRSFLILGLSVACTLVGNAQTAKNNVSAAANNQTSAATSQSGKNISLESGTSLSGQLQSAIDVRHAKVGDQVILKTTQAVKSGGRTVVARGSRLVGHVTEVAQKSKDNGESRIAILFDRLEQGSLQTPITATITSITSGRVSVNANNEDPFGSDTMASGSLRSTSSARSSSSSNGGLLGGAVNSTTSTVGSVVGGTTSAVGSTVDSTTRTVGSTTNGVGRSLGGIQVSQSSSTTVEGSSVLSLQGGDLKLDKGTNFNIVLTQSAGAGTPKDQ